MKPDEIALYAVAAVALYVILTQKAPAAPVKAAPVTIKPDPAFGNNGVWYYQDGA